MKLVPENVAGDGNSIDDEFSPDDSQILHVIAQHMDITEPLSTLRSFLEQKLGLELSDYTFYLQDVHELDSCQNLVDQCVEGEGLVQVNVEISMKGGLKKINIVDVLKPADEIRMKRVPEVLPTVENVGRTVSELGLGGPSDMTGEMVEAATDSIVEFHAGNGKSIDDEFSHDDSQILHVIAQHMDITEPLSTLRSFLEQKLGLELSDYTFYLQDVHELDSCQNLVDQCVEGEGLVQVNVEISTKGGLKKINIVDVLKPAEEIEEMPSHAVLAA